MDVDPGKKFLTGLTTPLEKDTRVNSVGIVNLLSSALSKILISLPFLVVRTQNAESLDKTALSRLLKS